MEFIGVEKRSFAQLMQKGVLGNSRDISVGVWKITIYGTLRRSVNTSDEDRYTPLLYHRRRRLRRSPREDEDGYGEV